MKKAAQKNNDGAMNVRIMVFPYFDEENAKFDGWCAVALEMDVWGFGTTAKKAEDDLIDLVQSQIEFAATQRAPNVLDHPADKKWFRLWEKARALQAASRGDSGDEMLRLLLNAQNHKGGDISNQKIPARGKWKCDYLDAAFGRAA